jgi:transcriptional regulator with XRE-family HTH domain
MDINEATAKAIAAERSAAGLTIKELANRSGVPERTLIRMLKNERDIKILQIAQIANVFNLYPHEIVDEAEHFMERDTRGSVKLESHQGGDISPDDRYRAMHVDELGLAAKHGDIDGEQQEYMQEP